MNHIFVNSKINCIFSVYKFNAVKMAEPQRIKKPPISSKIDISDAKVISDNNGSKGSPTSSVNDTIKSNEDYVKDLKDQKTINLDDVGKTKSGEKITMDFLDEEHINKFTASETNKSAEAEEPKTNFDGKSAEQLKEDIKKAEEASAKNFTAKDFEDIASFIIFLIDTGIASSLKWWAKDTSESAYSLPEGKKKMLTYQLTLILVKYQAKFSLEFMFILTLLIIYAPAFMKARERKKEIKAASQVTHQAPIETTPEAETGPPDPSGIKEVIKANVGAVKRKKGGQSKV